MEAEEDAAEAEEDEVDAGGGVGEELAVDAEGVADASDRARFAGGGGVEVETAAKGSGRRSRRKALRTVARASGFSQ